MMTKCMRAVLGASVGTMLAAIGCSTAEPDPSDAPIVQTEGVDENAAITVGSWTLDAHTPTVDTSVALGLWGSATFSGPAGGTNRMGVCLLRQYTANNVPVNCTDVSQCSAAPSNLPVGGFRYCTAPDGVAQKTCFYRQASPAQDCAGTPALGGIAIGAGTYTTPPRMRPINGGSSYYGTAYRYISYACVAGCATTDPSVSSAASVIIPPCERCGQFCCPPGPIRD